MLTVIVMSYRDDQDAALARAEALQVELDRSRRELERAKSTLAQRDADLAASERERKHLAKRVPATSFPPLTPMPPLPAYPRKTVHPLVAIGVATASFLAILGLTTCAKHAQQRQRAEQREQQKEFERYIAHSDLGAGTFRSCTVHTIPSGADVVSVDAAGTPYAMGSTPFSRSIGSWTIRGEHLEARLAGYEPVTLTEPEMDWKTSACEATITLVPLPPHR